MSTIPTFGWLPEAIRRPLRRVRHAPGVLVNLLHPGKMWRSALYHMCVYRLLGTRFEGVHLGSGGLRIKGFLNFDADVFIAADVTARSERIKLARESVGVIYASHLFEHIGRWDVPGVMRNWHRVLRPGGRLILCVPNLEALARIYLDNLAAYDSDNATRRRADLACGIIYGGQSDKYDFHCYGYSMTSMRALLREIGFRSVEQFERKDLEFAPFFDGGYAEIDGMPVSLNVEAVK